MIPVLYDSITEGTMPQNFGRGPLTDCLLCNVHEERNGQDELSFDYPANGIHAEDIQALKIIKAKPNYTDDPQLFEIYKVGKVLNGRFTVNARHISYRLSNKLITSGTASSCVAACALLDAQAGNFTINTDKTSAGAFAIAEPSSVRSWFGGKEGSLLDVYGGEWKYDNFTASLLQARGADRGVTIRYGKNLTQLSQEISVENLATAILPYYKDMDGNVTTGAKINTGLSLDSPREIAVDFSQEVDPESATPIVTQLATLGAAYISKNNFTVAINSITLSFEELEGLNERVDLCDTVHIYFEALGITATAKCVATTWDVLNERYTACTFGETRANIADTIATTSKELSQTPSRSFMSEAIMRATELITGNLGGYVVLHDSNGDGYPDELLIMNTPDIATATKVWRWNSGGLGYSSSGYSGPYGTAITQAGQIVANYVSTGTLNADLIKAGTIEDVNHNSTINMTTGAAVLNQLKAKQTLTLIDTNGTTKALLDHTGGTGGTRFRLYDTNNTALVDAWAYNGTGSLNLHTSSDKKLIDLGGSTTAGGTFLLYNNSQTKIVEIGAGSGNKDGILYLFDNGGSTTINALAQTGKITCVSLVQTSSRKVKENIKPIEDAAKILELNAVAFDYKQKDRGVNKRGFIAEDVEKVLPNLVNQESGDTPASLDYLGMIPYLQAIIKDHEKRIADLEEKINELKARD